ncbi:MAG: glycosyltransferase family 1 protein, partial [Chitinophagaceae bacterium]
SPIGVNKIIVEEGINGFFCKTEEEWYQNIEKLLLNANLRKQLGLNGRSMVESRYSLRSNSENFLQLFS